MSWTSSRRRLTIIGAALLAVIGVAVVQIIAMERSASIEAFRTAAINLARGMSAQTELALATVDAELRNLQQQLPADLAPPRAAGMLADAQEHTPDAMAFFAGGADGHVIDPWEGPPGPAPVQAVQAAMAYFRTPGGHAAYVSVPARSDGEWVAFIARPLGGGPRAGVVLAEISLSRWENFYRIAMPPHRTATLYRQDGTVLVRYPREHDITGRKLPAGSSWHAGVEAGGATYVAPDVLDGRPIIAAVRPLRGMPLVIETAITQQEALAGWQKQKSWTLVGGIAAAVGVVVLLRLFGRQIRRLEASEMTLAARNGQLEAARRQFDVAVDNISQGLCFFSGDQTLIVCNRRYGEIYGYPAEVACPGASLTDILAFSPVKRRLDDPLGDSSPAAADLVPQPGRRQHSLVELNDGRVISIVQQPMADGGWVATHEDVTERRQAEARIKFMARHDLLTGLPNRSLFQERIGLALAGGSESALFAVLFLDLDRFKQVNDTLGHPAGDELLRAVAARLTANVREHDTVARLGGDEFVVLQTRVACPDDAAHLANRIIHAVSQPYLIAGQDVSIGVSIGVELSPKHGASADSLLKNADIALYVAKSGGRGQFCFFTPEMDATVQIRHALERDLRHAVRQHEFELYYQPVADTASGDLCAFEALLRWNHPVRGLLAPSEFIDIADDTGLIVPITEWVLGEACREAAGWPPGIHVAVNLSTAHFRLGNVARLVEQALAAARLEPHRLELEITESVVLQGNAATQASLADLRHIGVAIVMDDFGTGTSSLASLRQCAFDKVKIDRSFVADLARVPDALCIVRAIIGLCHDLAIRTCVEGVETADQLSLLLEEGCSEVQGFFLGRPQPAHTLPALIGTRRLIPEPCRRPPVRTKQQETALLF